MSERTLVLNSSYQVIDIINWERAITHLYEGDAEVLKEWDDSSNKFRYSEYDKTVSNSDKRYVYKIPAIIRLTKSNFYPKNKKVKYSKINVMYRDNFTCQYCGFKNDNIPNSHFKKLTIDHVQPTSRGGSNSFENCVCACQKCNSEKADRTPSEAGMKLMRKPIIPSMNLLTERISKRKIHSSWETYLNTSPI